jgi:hypothetical protein
MHSLLFIYPLRAAKVKPLLEQCLKQLAGLALLPLNVVAASSTILVLEPSAKQPKYFLSLTAISKVF